MKDASVEERIYELHAELCSALFHTMRLKILNLLRDIVALEKLSKKINLKKAVIKYRFSL